jgi:alpha-tubulin suppressor-like RCC1 family protein
LLGQCAVTCDPGYVACQGGCCRDVRLIAANADGACAVVGESLVCWGVAWGHPTPTVMAKLDWPPAELVLGEQHGCMRSSAGDVRCWGEDGVGELGDGNTIYAATPVQAQGLTSGAISLAAGPAFSCAVGGGALDCWGWIPQATYAPPPPSTLIPTAIAGIAGAVQVAGGSGHACTVGAAGRVDCFGFNLYGQLGDGTTTGRSAPAPVAGLPRVVALTAGYEHTCALTDSGGVACWGDNSAGQLGRPAATDSTRPGFVTGLTSGVAAIVAGVDHTCALLGGRLKCWGDANSGTLGPGGSSAGFGVPVDVPGFVDVVGITAGDGFTCALTASRAVMCWGNNSNYQLGFVGAGGPTPVKVPL